MVALLFDGNRISFGSRGFIGGIMAVFIPNPKNTGLTTLAGQISNFEKRYGSVHSCCIIHCGVGQDFPIFFDNEIYTDELKDGMRICVAGKLNMDKHGDIAVCVTGYRLITARGKYITKKPDGWNGPWPERWSA